MREGTGWLEVPIVKLMDICSSLISSLTMKRESVDRFLAHVGEGGGASFAFYVQVAQIRNCISGVIPI